MKLSAPTVCNLEITDACNFRCSHCYNPCREGERIKEFMPRDRFELIVAELWEAGVFHVVLSGGEPLLLADRELEYRVSRLLSLDMSVSLNSNLALATPSRMHGLAQAGLEHVLTSWHGWGDEYVTGDPRTREKVEAGIGSALVGGVRVSANMIVTAANKDTVYESGLRLHKLGVTKFFAHRVIPPDPGVSRDDALQTLDELLRVKADTGMEVGTLISYPLCMLGDLERYAPFVGRGCPSQRGHRSSVGVDGSFGVCVMEPKAYGNVLEDGLKACWERSATVWQDDRCYGCKVKGICQGGCRMSGQPDPLMFDTDGLFRTFKTDAVGSSCEPVCHDPITVPFRMDLPTVDPTKVYHFSGLRFRQENGFTLCNVRYGNTIRVTDAQAKVLRHGMCFEVNYPGNFAEFLWSYQNTQGVSLDPADLL